jgi:potassium-transporting ATPase potassium-binding subunit
MSERQYFVGGFLVLALFQGQCRESTMSYLTQMAGLTLQNFLSAATGILVAIALIRGIARQSAGTIGNFRTDVMRCALYVPPPPTKT